MDQSEWQYHLRIWLGSSSCVFGETMCQQNAIWRTEKYQILGRSYSRQMGPALRQLRQKRLKFIQPPHPDEAAPPTGLPSPSQSFRQQIRYQSRRIFLQRVLHEQVISLELHSNDPTSPSLLLSKQWVDRTCACAAGWVRDERRCYSAVRYIFRGYWVVRIDSA